MPKPKPDHVQRMEIIFGSRERQIIEDFNSTWMLQTLVPNTITAFTGLFTNPAALYALLIAIERVFKIEIPGVISSDDEALDMLMKWTGAVKTQLAGKTEADKLLIDFIREQIEQGNMTREEGLEFLRDYEELRQDDSTWWRDLF